MILVIGAGVAGLSAALAAAGSGAEVTLVTPGALWPGAGAGSDDALGLGGGNTALAQGGIAAALGIGDSVADHAADTVAAGGGIVDAEAAALLTARGRDAVSSLLLEGFSADRGADGALLLGLEGAHRRARIVHAGEDRSGAALHAHLLARLRAAQGAGRIALREGWHAESLILDSGAVIGAVFRGVDDALINVSADAVVLATGGYAALFSRTSNHAGARGEGIVLAARAGALVADLEFVQFHPTVLHGTGFLVSEAVRGAGAVLRDEAGRRFMLDVDPRGELASRDVVSRALNRVMSAQAGRPVWLDATGIEEADGPGSLARRFPRIAAAASAQGFDWARESIPVSPAAHYSMGGVLSDVGARSSVPGLFVAGEAASTGVHGANRLASNSLLEGLVFGEIAGHSAASFAAVPASARAWTLRGAGVVAAVARAGTTGLLPSQEPLEFGQVKDPHPGFHAGDRLAHAFDAGLGIERDAVGIARADRFARSLTGPGPAMLALMCEAAERRAESRGAHARSDFPEADPSLAERRAFRPRFPAAATASRSHSFSVPASDFRSVSAC